MTRPAWWRWYHVLPVRNGFNGGRDPLYRESWVFPWEGQWWRDRWMFRVRIGMWWRPLRWLGIYDIRDGQYWHEGRYRWDFWRTQRERVAQARHDGWTAGVKYGKYEANMELKRMASR